jgi:hypothetical protein
VYVLLLELNGAVMGHWEDLNDAAGEAALERHPQPISYRCRPYSQNRPGPACTGNPARADRRAR